MSRGKRVCAVILTVLFAWVLTADVLCLTAVYLIKSEKAAAGAAQAVEGMQREAVLAEVDRFAAAWSFDPEPVRALVTPEMIRQSDAEAIAWWRALLTDEPMENMPVWTVEGVEELVYNDAGFKAAVDAFDRKIVARDTVAAGLDKALSDAVLPVRANVLNRLLQNVSENHRPARLVSLFKTGTIILTVLCALLLACLIILCVHNPKFGMGWLGGGLAGGGLCLIFALLAIRSLNIPGQVAELSLILEKLLVTWLSGPVTVLWIGAAVLTAAGFALIALRDRKSVHH